MSNNDLIDTTPLFGGHIIDPPANLSHRELFNTVNKGFANYTVLTEQDWTTVIFSIMILKDRHGYNFLTMNNFKASDPFVRDMFEELLQSEVNFNEDCLKAMNDIRRELILQC